MSLNRLSGLFFTLFGLLLYFFITPAQTEMVDFGWLKPRVLPDIATCVIICGGFLHFIYPTGKTEINVRTTLRIGLFLIIILATLFLMKTVGYVVAAPAMILVLLLIIGERRVLWLSLATVFTPLLIWFSIVVLLNKSLP